MTVTPKGPNKRGKGEGSVYQRQSDGMWIGSIELPSPDPKVRRRKTVVASSKSQALEKLRKVRAEKEKAGDLPTAGQTLGTWVAYWFANIAVKKIRPGTAATYRTNIDHYIIPSIGKVRLDKLSPAHVRQMHDFITDQGLSSTTARQAHQILSVALKYAEREGRVTKNVAAATDAPRRAVANLGVLSGADGIRVLETVVNDRLGSRWWAALLTGARQGELLGLELDRVTDVLDLSWQLTRVSWEHGCDNKCGRIRGTDCPQKKITVPADWEYRRLTGGLLLSRPKSSTSWRIIPLVEPLKSMIYKRMSEVAEEPNPHNLLWTAEQKYSKGGSATARKLLSLDGSPIDPSRDNAAWHEVLMRAGVADVRLHDARHTTASLLLKAGVPEAIIMRILGHNSYVVTRGYQDIDREQMDAAMTKLASQLTS